MKFLYGLGGANVPVIKDFELSNANMFIESGYVVKCNEDGKVTSNSDDKILGVAAENHSNKKDILNSRNNGKKLRVDITKYGVYRADAPRVVVSKAGSATTVYTQTSDLSGTIKNLLLVLIEKGEGSENTDAIGTARKISNYATDAPDNVITVATGSISYPGDIYAIVPSVGGEYPISEGYTSISYGVGNGGKVKVIGRDVEKGTIDVILKETIFD